MSMQIASLNTISDYTVDSLPSAMFGPAQRALHTDIFYSLKLLEDLSFQVIDDDKRPLACCLMTVCETSEKTLRISNFGHPAVFWFTEKMPIMAQSAVEKLVKGELKKRLSTFPTNKISGVDYFSRGCLSPLSQAIMQLDTASADMSFTHILPLQNNIESRYAALRGSYKSLIRKAQKEFMLSIIDHSNYKSHDITKVRLCHTRASGRDVHWDCFWEAMGILIKQKNAFIVLAEDDNDVQGVSIITICDHQAYYSLGAYNRDLSHTGLSHACVWAAIKYASSQKNIFSFETGRTDFTPCSPHITDKEMNIGFFKRGFGGINKPVLYVSKQ